MREIDAVKIRVQLELIEKFARQLFVAQENLKMSFEALSGELDYADPQYDRPFERYMLLLARVVNAGGADRARDLMDACATIKKIYAGEQKKESAA